LAANFISAVGSISRRFNSKKTINPENPQSIVKTNKRASIQLAAAIFVVGLATSTVPAATIDWGSGAQNITGDSDVSTDGTLVDAFAFGTETSALFTTVNGVTFAPLVFPEFGNVTALSPGNYNFSLNSGGHLTSYGNLGTPGIGAYAGLSSSYASLLGSGGSATSASGAGPLTLTISGLMIGQTYQFQWWANNSSFSTSSSDDGYQSTSTVAIDSNGSFVGLQVNDLSNGGSLGQYAIGTFTADALTEGITFYGNSEDNGDMIINGMQLRDITPTPEPSTWALSAMGGLGSLLVFRRRK
jgi:hypothetical protein